MRLKIITVGSLKEKYLRDGCTEYIKRLSGYGDIAVTELKEYKLGTSPSPAEIELALADEGKRIVKSIPKSAFTFALCVEGTGLSSEEFSSLLTKKAGGEICFIIGGSFGLSQEVKSLADFKLSFSGFTFPHQLIRLILLEQLYRAANISAGGKYHK